MQFKILLSFSSALLVLLSIGKNGFSSAATVDRKDLAEFDSIGLELVTEFAICDEIYLASLSVTAMKGRIYAVCNSTDNIRVFDSTTYERLDDIEVQLSQSFSRLYISSCSASSSLFLVDQAVTNSVDIMKVTKIEVGDNSQSTWMTQENFYATAVSTSLFDCRLAFIKWELEGDSEIKNTIMVYDQGGSLVRTVPVPFEIKFPKTVLETKSGTYLLAEGRTRALPYLIKHLDRNGKLLETLRRDDTVHNAATSTTYDPVGIDIDQMGYVYAAGTTGEILLFDQGLDRNRVMIPPYRSGFATRVLYDVATDRVLVFMPYKKKMAAYAIRANVTCNK